MMQRLIVCLVAIIISCCNKQTAVNVPKQRPNVMVILLDTLRADHLGSYGYHRDTSPNLDNFAKDNIKFSYAITPAPWTPPAVASLFTGLYPRQHGMMPPNSRTIATGKSVVLSESNQTLAEYLKELGYKSSAISSNPWITADFNYDQGFDGFTFIERAPATVVTDRAIRRIKHLTQDIEQSSSLVQPFFLYVHYLDPHDPYKPPEKYTTLYTEQPNPHGSFQYPENMAKFVNMYDGEIRYLDDELGKLFRFLKSSKLYDDMLIVIVGDHGEQFMERGDHTHGFKLYNEEVHVPLLMRIGKNTEKNSEFSEVVSLVDIVPTILNIVAPEQTLNLPGINLLDSAARASRSFVTTEIRRKYDQRALVRVDHKKLIMSVDYDELNTTSEQSEQNWKANKSKVVGLYDSKQSYFEEQSLEQDSGLSKLFTESLQAGFNDQLKEHQPPKQTSKEAIGDEKLEQLRSLGYVQ